VSARFYPIVLDLRGRACLVIGGGPVAERKVTGLVGAGARVTVISPQLTERLAAWADEGTIRYVARSYQADDLAGYPLAFIATDDTSLNEAVATEARVRGTWVNAADDPEHCDFILPSVLRRGDLVIAVATGGTSPALARSVREELEEHILPEYGVLTEIAGEVRRELRASGLRVDPETWRRALGGDVRRLVAARRRDDAQAHLRAAIEVALRTPGAPCA
jgi:siroheme synthase-like protein